LLLFMSAVLDFEVEQFEIGGPLFVCQKIQPSILFFKKKEFFFGQKKSGIPGRIARRRSRKTSASLYSRTYTYRKKRNNQKKKERKTEEQEPQNIGREVAWTQQASNMNKQQAYMSHVSYIESCLLHNKQAT
jgi:hypothetical protein